MSDRPETREASAGSPATPVRLVVRSDRFIRWIVASCIAAEVLFVFLDYHVNYGRLTDIGALRRLCNIAREDSLASWFGTTQTLMIGLTLWLIYFAVRGHAAPRWVRRGWFALAVFFTYMAVDDGAMLHERLGTTLSELESDNGLLDAFPSYAWFIGILPLFAAMGIFMFVFLWRELGQRRARALVLVALCCLVVAIGLDFVEGLDRDHPLNVVTRIVDHVDFGDYTEYRFRRDTYDTLTHFSKSIEEFLEMLGNTLLWLVFLRHLTRVGTNLHVRFE